MSWRTVVQARQEFVKAALEEDINLTRLSANYGISRKTAYKWLKRYEERGRDGLEDLSRRRKHPPCGTAAQMQREILEVRKDNPDWGGITIRSYLQRRMKNVPSPRTIDRILKRAGVVDARLVKNVPAPHCDIPHAMSPNQMWSSDFKGWWETKDKKRFEPLTIKDWFSKYIFKAAALRDSRTEAVKEAYFEVFSTFGLPIFMLTDNGPPFANNGFCGLTKLSLWWIKLGIIPVRIPAGKPGKNGSHERMHRDIARIVESNPARNKSAQQRKLSEWVNKYNYLRPHHALALSTPAEVYVPSTRCFDPSIKDFSYPESFIPISVNSAGYLTWRRSNVYLSEAFAKETIALQPLPNREFDLWFRDIRLATTTKQSFEKLIEVF